MARPVHDRGGWPTSEPIDQSEHPLADWELLTDALQQSLVRNGVITVDELRRGIESMPPEAYEAAGYYERWLYSLERILVEKAVIAPWEIDRKLAEAAG